MKSKKYIFTGGGTGGHVYPAIAIADELLRLDPEAEILYVGNKKGAESHILPKKGYKVKYVASVGLTSGILSFKFIRFLLIQFMGFLKSLFIILSFRPDAVVGTGGYVSAPVVIANVFLRKLHLSRSKIIIHEQNVVPGRLNDLVARFSDLTIVSSSQTKDILPQGIILGYPVRKSEKKISKEEAKRRLNIPEDKKVVFIFGGSTGARTINRAVIEALPLLAQYEKIFVIHGIGRYRSLEYDAVKDTDTKLKKLNFKREKSQFYLAKDYFYEIDLVYSAADLVVSRAGAGTIEELKSIGLPSIIIPKANLPGDHQVLNARALEQSGACSIIFEEVKYDAGKVISYVDGEKLAQKVIDLLFDENKLNEIKINAGKSYNRESLSEIKKAIIKIVKGENVTGGIDLKDKMNSSDIKNYYNLGAYGLLRKVNQLVQGIKDKDITSLPEWDYLSYRAAGYLVSDNWEIRNVGVKLLGLLKNEKKLNLLISILMDKRPSSSFKKFFGGDYFHVGFIRRNTVYSIMNIGVYNNEIRDVLISVLRTDPYYEVRAAAAEALTQFSDEIKEDIELENVLIENLNHSSFEVVNEAITALGKIAFSEGALEHLKKMLFSTKWQFRDSAVRAFIDISERGNYKDIGELRSFLKDIMVVCTDFKPEFPLKKSILDLNRRIEKRS
ncbi:glycosyltransferase [candidate division KSB1 bacterium]